MPALLSMMTEGKIVSWIKSKGDKLSKGESVVVVESDKADMDVETLYDGYLASIMVEVGGVAPVDSAIALLTETEAEIEQARSKAQSSSSSSETLDSDSPPQSGNQGVDVSSASRIDEDDKLKALIETPALDWSCQGQDGFGGRGFGRGFGRGMMAGRGFGRGGFERKTPLPGYICHRCKVPSHFIQHCPTNGDPNYDVRKVKPPTGIPKL